MSTDARVGLLLAIADDELILGHRVSEWTGWVPYVEEDLALSSIAQDEMAHARALYELVSAIDGRTIDELALGRAPEGYRNAHLCERPNADFAFTIARHWLYDTADDVRLRALADSSFKELRELTLILRMEERYHLEHANAWFARLAGGPVKARQKLSAALNATFGEAMALFEPLDREDELLSDGTLPRSNEDMLAEWLSIVGRALDDAGLDQVTNDHAPSGEMIPTSSGEMSATARESETLKVPGLQRQGDRWVHSGGFIGAGGRRGVHSQDFEPMWLEMTALYRAHPGARW